MGDEINQTFCRNFQFSLCIFFLLRSLYAVVQFRFPGDE